MITRWKLLFVGIALLATLLTESEFGDGLAMGIAIGLIGLGLMEIVKGMRIRKAANG